MSATSAIVIVLVISIITLGVLAAVSASMHSSTKHKKKPTYSPPSTDHRSDESSCDDGIDSAKMVYEEALEDTSDQINFMKKYEMDLDSVPKPSNICMMDKPGNCSSDFTNCTNELNAYIDRLNDVVKGNMIVPHEVSSAYNKTLEMVKTEEKYMRSVGLIPEKTPGYSSKLLMTCDNGNVKSEGAYIDCTKGLLSYYNNMKSVPPPVYPSGLSSEWDMQKWAWCDDCKSAPRFIVETQWPTFLDKSAWDDGCQGTKSIPATTSSTPDCQQNNSKDSFHIAGQWMRISQRNFGSMSNVSTANSKKHWFNPPRDEKFLQPGEKEDDPLEIEWFMHMDASDIANSIEELQKSNVANVNWSAFWAFGHGRPANSEDGGLPEADKNELDELLAKAKTSGQNVDTVRKNWFLTKYNYGWPYGGEWDLAESLPAFSTWDDMRDPTVIGRGIATGFHNGASGAFPPCCLKRDGVMYPKPTKEDFIKVAAFPAVDGPVGTGYKKAQTDGKGQDFLINNNDEIYYFPQGTDGQPFLSWGQAIFRQKHGKNPESKDENRLAAVLSLNNTIHCILRVTTKSAALWILPNADPTKELNVNLNSEMTQVEYGNNLNQVGFIQVFSSYGDFGSNNDTTFSSQFSGNFGQVAMGPLPGTKDTFLPFQGTNWHQNMMFVWSVITQMNRSGRYTNTVGTLQSEFWNHLTSYMSDIHIRGGGDYTKALRPANMPSGMRTSIATEEIDPSSAEIFYSGDLGHYSCSSRAGLPTRIKCENILTK